MELADILVGHLSSIYLTKVVEVWWGFVLTGSYPMLYQSACKKIQKATPVNLTSVPGEVMEKIVLDDIERQLKKKAISRYSQNDFIQWKSCLSNLISFYNKITPLVNGGEVVDIIFLEFSKAFGTIPHGSLLEYLSTSEINIFTLCWAVKWLNSSAQMIAGNKATSVWCPVTSAVPICMASSVQHFYQWSGYRSEMHP